MNSFMQWIRRFFGAAVLPEDPLSGAIDLSDAAYCLGLLANSEE